MKSFFNKQHQKLIADPLGDQNPITIQVLGICSALAITTQLENALVMTLAVIFVMTSAVHYIFLKSCSESHKNNSVASCCLFGCLVDQILKAFLPDASEQLSVLLG